jgi:integrating conjugative element membrane protein (TIGR03747 family)
MASQRENPYPRRKEPGLIGRLFSALVQLIVWLIVSLFISVIIEWIGMIWWWPEQGPEHAKAVLSQDKTYLNQQLLDQSAGIKNRVAEKAYSVIRWIEHQRRLKGIGELLPRSNQEASVIERWAHDLYQRYKLYLEASVYVVQTFVIRLTLILFSSPIFAIAAVVGSIDGLVERDLRRWGGGRESSNVFNLARRSVAPAFVTACVVYISLPVSISPVIVVLPFAILLGLAVRLGFERLK